MESFYLAKPNLNHAQDIANYRAECLETDGHINGASGLAEAEDMAVWVEKCRTKESGESVSVPRSQFIFMCNGNERIIGMVNIRHSLDSDFAEHGGHIGYSVRPSERRKGCAKKLLALALGECRGLGINKVLITCAENNEASRRTILALGGVFERMSLPDEDGEITERYWVEL